MHKLLLAVCLIAATATYSQTNTATNEVKSLTNALSDSKPDTGQIRILLQLAKHHIFKPGENKNDLDSAANFINRAEKVNATIQSTWAEGYTLLIKSYLLKESNEKDKARQSLQDAVSKLKNETDKNLLGEAYGELAGYYDYNEAESLETKLDLVKLAVKSFEESGNIQQKAANLQMLGDLYNIKGNGYVALQHLQAALDAYNSIQYKQVQGIYTLMGFIHARKREFHQALEKQLLALKTAEANGDSSMQLCQIYNNLAETFLAFSDKEKAITYYSNALAVAERHRDIPAIYISNVNIANVWASMNMATQALSRMKEISAKYEKPKNVNLDYNIARCYINIYCQLKQFEKARPYANQLLQTADNLKLSDNAKISQYTVAIRFFSAAGEVAEANKYLEKHNELAQKLDNFYYLAANQKLRFILDTTLHNYKAATTHLLEFSRLNDSANQQSKSRQIEELQVQFETEKKEQAIVAKDKDIRLLTNESRLQRSEIARGRLLRSIMIAAAGLLLLFLIVVYRWYRIKKRNNQLLSEHQAQIDEQNASLQSLVKEQKKLIGEKEWLLKEIHHRVKNNLQVVMSLLNSQSAFIDNEHALTAIHDSQHRVHAMSLIHQKLYSTENVSSIDMSHYIRELVSYLADSFDTAQRIGFELNIDPIEMDVSQAVPLGLILNEAITNSIKYAFPGDRRGRISISLTKEADNRYELTISDNGIGTPVNIKKTGSLGMSLMKGLSEDIDANFSIENRNGTLIKVSFAHEMTVRKQEISDISLVSNN